MLPSPVVGHEIGEAIRAVVPPWLVPVFVAVTRLGNPGLFLVLFAVDYWFGDHRRGAHALAIGLGGIALVTGLKSYFAAPRPPEEITAIPITGYAFPSGHATGATIGYGILASDLDVGSWRWRYALAAVLVALVALSRVVLGVHYVRDVVAGIVVGICFLAGAIWLTDHDPRTGFVLAVVLGALGFVVSGASHDGTAVLGAALGGAAAWHHLDGVPSVRSSRRSLVLFGLLLPVLLVVAFVGAKIALPVAAVFVVNALLTAVVLAAPDLVTRVTRGA